MQDANVVSLHEHRLRLNAKSGELEAAPGATECYVSVTIDADGDATTVAHQIEAHQVPTIIEELGGLIARLTAFARANWTNPAAYVALASAMLYVDALIAPAMAYVSS